MHITFSPCFCRWPLTLERDGDALILNGDRFDFTRLPEGATLPHDAIGSEYFKGPVERLSGELHLTILLPYSDADAPESVRFPAPITVTRDGPIPVPGKEDTA